MEFSLHLRKISSKRQSSSKTTKDIPRDSDKLKSKSGVEPAHIDPCHKTRQSAVGKVQNRESVNRSSTQRDELVKYMSNLPGYLQRADRGVNNHDKAFNVGVLDWSQLEKWKKNKQPALARNFASSNSNEESSSTIASDSRKLHDKRVLPSSSIKASYKEGLPESSKLSSQNVKGNQHSASQIKTFGEELGLKPSEFESFGKIQSDTSLEKNSLNKNERNQKSSCVTGLKSKHKGVSSSSHTKMSSSRNGTKKIIDHLEESDIDVDYKAYHSKPSNIVLLRPRKVTQCSSPEYFELSQLRTSPDEFFSESNQSSLSFFSPPHKISTEEFCSDIPQSSVLASVTEPSSETKQHIINSDLDIDHSSVGSKKPACIENDILDNKLRNQCAFTNLKESWDQETTEHTDQISTNPSSQYGPSFSLERIGRSFSLNERSTLPQLSSMYISAKSGPMTSQSSACLDNSSKEKVRRSHNRTRSSSFLRLLDPILKHKASNTQDSSLGSPTTEGSMSSISFTTTSLHGEKNQGSSIQALLQLTVKNGLPLFKFVLNSERKVFAATMKSLASPGKDDDGCCFTFYLVNEIKKKSGGWMSYGSKEKSCGYVYNKVGQMKLSRCKIKEPSNDNCNRRCMVKEYVLLGDEIDQTDREPLEFIKRRELAAVVIEIPCKNLSDEGLQNDDFMQKGCLKCMEDERCFCSSGENHTSGSTTVILPSGVHSAPNNGEPSPLIDRWKSGGTCDCGGWDVGCKLLVLCSKSYLEIFQLFVQEGDEQNTPLFTMAPLKDGLYSVEFRSKIDHLQAFFISVAVLSSQKLPNSLEMSNMYEEINKQLSSKYINDLQGNVPTCYNPIPPLSPVGRV